MIVNNTVTLDRADQLEHLRIMAMLDNFQGPLTTELACRLAAEISLFLRRHPEADWSLVRESMDSVSDMIRNARNRTRFRRGAGRNRNTA